MEPPRAPRYKMLVAAFPSPVPSIFLSYRRSDAAGWAGRLHDSLERQLPGVQIFMDVEGIPAGVKFGDFLQQAVARCDVLIALIGPAWLSATDAEGRVRLQDPSDVTRLEIAAALQRDVLVVPLLVGGARMPTPRELPDALAGLCARQNHELHDRAWDEGCNRLAEALRSEIFRRETAWQRLLGPLRRHPAASAGLIVLMLVLAAVSLAWRPWADAPRSAPEPIAHAPAAGTPLPPSNPDFALGTWTLNHATDNEGNDWSDSTLKFTAQSERADGLRLEGKFSWRLRGVAVGTETVEGSYIASKRHIILEGRSVTDFPNTQNNRLAVGSYSAVVSEDERALLNGTWGSTMENEAGSPGRWQATR